MELMQKMEEAAKKYRLEIVTCAAQNRLTNAGIKGEGCVGKGWIEGIVGYQLKAGYDKTQRKGLAYTMLIPRYYADTWNKAISLQ